MTEIRATRACSSPEHLSLDPFQARFLASAQRTGSLQESQDPAMPLHAQNQSYQTEEVRTRRLQALKIIKQTLPVPPSASVSEGSVSESCTSSCQELVHPLARESKSQAREFAVIFFGVRANCLHGGHTPPPPPLGDLASPIFQRTKSDPVCFDCSWRLGGYYQCPSQRYAVWPRVQEDQL